MFCEIYLRSATHIISDPKFIYLFYFQVLFNRSLIPDFDLLLIKIILFFFSTTDQLFQNNQRFQAIEFLDQPVPEKLDIGFLLTVVMKCYK